VESQLQTFLSSYELNSHRSGLAPELAHADDRQLLDIGLVRAADGSLRRAEDPSQPAGPGLPRRSWSAVSAAAGLFRWLRGLPLRGAHWHPHFFLRE
jgi:hypothetical protein